MKHEAVDLLFIISFYLCRRKLFGFNKLPNALICRGAYYNITVKFFI